MSELIWSWQEDNENWNAPDPLEALDGQDMEPMYIGQYIDIYSAETEPVSIVELLPNFYDEMVERAYELVGEHSESWQPDTKEFEYHVEQLAKKLFPRLPFWLITNVKKVTFKILEVDSDGVITNIEETGE